MSERKQCEAMVWRGYSVGDTRCQRPAQPGKKLCRQHESPLTYRLKDRKRFAKAKP